MKFLPLVFLGFCTLAHAAPPVVSNIRASQRPGTKLVDVYYDLSDADGDLQLVQMAVSADAGPDLTDGEEVHSLGTSPVTRDTDGDGQDDASELSAGTNPLVPQSRFAAAMGSVVPGVSAAVHWNGVAGRSYRVVRSQELGTLNMDFLKAGLEGVSGPMTYVDPNPPPLKAFYWIEVE